MSEEKGKDKFLKSSDAFFGRVADYLDNYTIGDGLNELAKLKEVCDVVKITATSIKALEVGEEKKKKVEEKGGSRVDRKADQRRSE